MKSIYLLLTAMTVTVMSCRTKDGEPGPAGQADLIQQGSVAGTIAYVDIDGKPLKESFSYEFYQSLANAYYTDYSGGYTIEFSRRDLKDYNKAFSFTLYGSKDQSGNPIAPEEGDFSYSYVSVTNNTLFSLSTQDGEGEGVYFGVESSSTCDITNFSYNAATGRLIFDYKIDLDQSDIDWDDRYDDATNAEIDGHVDVVVLYKKRLQMPA